MKKIIKLLSIILIPIFLSSCSLIFKEETKEYKERTEYSKTYDTTSDLYNHYKKTDVSFHSLSYASIYNSIGGDYMPSTGNVNLLVLPVEIKDYEFNDNYKELLNIAINGNDTDTNYWESLKSFYYKSSYEKLNITATIADKYETNLTPYELIHYKNSLPDTSQAIVQEAFDNYKENNNITDYDNDNNGTIDAIIAIYSCSHTSNDNYLKTLDPKSDLFWAYSYQISDYSLRDKTNPIANNYLWMSIEFFYIDDKANYKTLTENSRIDCHTLIHETGHLMGLDDYYSYDNSRRNPAGGFDMMDENIGDHSAFSKLSLGWINPYHVYGNATLTINDFESSGDVILISDNWNNTAFDEYILIELYTPTGLNYLDATNNYYNKDKLYSNVGIKLWHVDSRVIKESKKTGNVTYVVSEPSSLNNGYYYSVAASNSDSDNSPDKGYRYDLLRLIENKTDILENNRMSNGYATNDSLWYENDSFTLENKSNMFPRSKTFNNGNKFNYEIVIDELTSTSCQITVNKI